ncbi:MAG: hypothetical protein BMS9Abin39_0376 [Ignavibacteria bacterium]|jgi:hypothetical protein|nr:MAG: hypothetical protein BMS9Abin39_0376 [Ignavibacteria bacterium]
MRFILLIIITLLLLPFRFFAQSEIHKSNLEEENHFHYNHIAMFIGASSLFEREETHFTLGADYKRYFSPESNFAVGIYTEAIFAQHTEWVFGAVLFYELTEQLWIRTGPGIEILQEENEHTGETESKIKFLIRIGSGYDFHIGTFTVTPSVDIDFLRSTTTLVWGINFGMGF